MSYRNTVKCDCGAIVGIGTRWVTGFWDDGTADDWTTTGTIPAGQCPMCRRVLHYGLWTWMEQGSMRMRRAA